LASLELRWLRPSADHGCAGVAAACSGTTLLVVCCSQAAAAAAEAVGRGEQVEPLRSPLVEANILTSSLSQASSELKRQEHSEFLMRELAHPAKNQFAVVRGMALQMANQSGSVDEFVAQFTRRLQGFAESQELLLRQAWQGAWMSDLVHAHLDLFGAGTHVQASGPPIFFSAQAVQNIGFGLHELATNASETRSSVNGGRSRRYQLERTR
jgi:hypothetical protein